MQLQWAEGEGADYYRAKIKEAERVAMEPCPTSKIVFCEICAPVRKEVLSDLRRLLKVSLTAS